MKWVEYRQLTRNKFRKVRQLSDFRRSFETAAYLAKSRAKPFGTVSGPDEWQNSPRCTGKEKNQKSSCAGVHRLKGIYTDGRYLSARLASLCLRHTKCLHEERSWMDRVKAHEVASLRFPVPRSYPEGTHTDTRAYWSLLKFKRNETTVPVEIFIACTTIDCFSCPRKRCTWVGIGSDEIAVYFISLAYRYSTIII